MTLDEIKELTEWLKEYTKIQGSLQTFTVDKDASGELVWGLGDVTAKPPQLLEGYLHVVNVVLIIEEDPAFVGARPAFPAMLPLAPTVVTPLSGTPSFTGSPLPQRSTFPPLLPGYLYRRAEVTLEIQNPTGKVSRKSRTHTIAL